MYGGHLGDMCPPCFFFCALWWAANQQGRRRSSDSIVLFSSLSRCQTEFLMTWWFFQMLINPLQNATQTSREGKRKAESKWLSRIWNPGEVGRETCLATLMLNFAVRERERDMEKVIAFSGLRMPHYLWWCESHQSSLLWSSVLDSGDGGDPLQGWGHSRSVLLIWLLRGACVTKGMHLSLPLR